MYRLLIVLALGTFAVGTAGFVTAGILPSISDSFGVGVATAGLLVTVFAIAYALPNGETLPYLPEGRVCFWGGWGGSMVVMDLDRRLTIAYAMNRMAPGILGSDRSEAYVKAIYDAVL